MFRIWCSVWRSASRSFSMRGSFAMAVVRPDERLAPLLRVVLAERVARELLVEQQAPEVRMTGEAHAVHVPDLTLHPVGGGPERAERIDLAGRLGHARLDAQAMIPRDRVEVVDHLEARRLAEVVHAGDVGEQVEAQLRVVARREEVRVGK